MIAKFSVKKPLTIIVSVIMIVILGFISFNKMNTDLLPSMDLPYVMVMTTYPGASSEKVETNVTNKLESTLATTSGIKEINSASSENSSMITLEFEQGSDMDSIMLELSSKIDTVKASFDEGIGNPIVMKINPNMMPIMIASVDVDGKERSEISKYVTDELIPKIKSIDGVASIETIGVIEEQIKVVLNEDKINELNKKILSNIDENLAKSQSELDNAKVQLNNGKNTLNSEGSKKTKELAEKSIEVNTGINTIENGISQIQITEKILEGTIEQLNNARAVAEKLINDNPLLEEGRRRLDDLDRSIAETNTKLTSLKSQKSQLEYNLSKLKQAQVQIEQGKLVLNQELSKAAGEITNNEDKLNSAITEFEKAKKEAYSKANIDALVSKDTISKMLMAQNFSMPAGYIEENNDKYLVKVGEQFNNIDELKNLVLLDTGIDGIGEVKLTDIADVNLTNNAEEHYGKINNNDGIILSIQKQSTSSTAEVAELINDKMDELMKENSKLHLTSLYDQGVYINIVVGTVIDNLIYGGLLAIVILFLFLRNIKPTIIIAFSIPISVLFAIVLMYFSDVNLNVISLSGLALGVGMLVDNSIVVIENIYRLRNEGMSAPRAAVEGAKQVSGAIVASTLTTICVFLPIVFTQGISRQLFTDMGLTIAYSLIASLIIALTLVPTMSSTILKNTTEKESKLFNKFVEGYGKLLRLALKHKAVVLGGVIVLLVISAFSVTKMGTEFIPSMDSEQMAMTLEMPAGTKVEELRETSNKVLDRVVDIKEIDTVGVMEGEGMMSFSSGNSSSHKTSFYILLDKYSKLTNEEVKEKIEKVTADINCELSIQTSTMDMSALVGSGINVKVKGNDIDKLKTIATDIENILKRVEGTIDVSSGQEENDKETKIVVDKNKAAKYGLTIAQVYQEVATAISNTSDSTTISVGDNEYPIIVVKDEKSSMTRDKLKEYKFKTTNYKKEEVEVRLSDIASVKEDEALDSIKHLNQVRTMSVIAGIDDEHNIGLVSKEFEKELKKYKVPKGYTVELQGENEEINETLTDLVYMVLLAIVFIYFIMVAQFQSLLSPFIVLFTIPLAFTGGLLALLVTGSELSVISMLGFLILSGIVVNNGIVFVDYVNQLRIGGMDKKEALIVAGKTRMRPILMTALTTILGLSTMALGIGMGAEMVQPMAIVTIGGLLYATALTLFVVPIIYDILQRRKIKVIELEDTEVI